jgi:hypothetical protein
MVELGKFSFMETTSVNQIHRILVNTATVTMCEILGQKFKFRRENTQ